MLRYEPLPCTLLVPVLVPSLELCRDLRDEQSNSLPFRRSAFVPLERQASRTSRTRDGGTIIHRYGSPEELLHALSRTPPNPSARASCIFDDRRATSCNEPRSRSLVRFRGYGSNTGLARRTAPCDVFPLISEYKR